MSRVSVQFCYQAVDCKLCAVELHCLSIFYAGLAEEPSAARTVYNALNLTSRELDSEEFWGRRTVLILVPFARALGGMRVRRRRAGFAQGENGLNLTEISDMNLVIILAAAVPVCLATID